MEDRTYSSGWSPLFRTSLEKHFYCAKMKRSQVKALTLCDVLEELICLQQLLKVGYAGCILHLGHLALHCVAAALQPEVQVPAPEHAVKPGCHIR